MSSFIIGGWSQNPADAAPSSFSVTMYGMVTNLSALTTGTPAAPGWSPNRVASPVAAGAVMWTYGGGGCTPENMPANEQEMDDIVSATEQNNWAGVDFDDECSMNVDNIICTMEKLKAVNKQTSYTFLAGWDYNNPTVSSFGQSINSAVEKVAQSYSADRCILMCYAAAMWGMSDIIANVGPAIERTINNGVPAKDVILALTPKGLTQENLNYFIDQVKSHNIGGLFIWDYPSLKADDLNTIETELGITQSTGVS